MPVTEIVLRAELESKSRELEKYQVEAASQRSHYKVSNLTADVLRMETGLPTKEVFDILVEYALRFKDSISYFYAWKVNPLVRLATLRIAGVPIFALFCK